MGFKKFGMFILMCDLGGKRQKGLRLNSGVFMHQVDTGPNVLAGFVSA